MPRRRRSPFDIFREFDELFEKLWRELPSVDLPIEGSYSIEMYQGPDGKMTIKVRLGPDADRRKVEEELRRRYPNAEIIVEGGREREKFERVEETEGEARIFRPFAEEESTSEKRPRRRRKVARRPREESGFFVVEKVERLDEDEE